MSLLIATGALAQVSATIAAVSDYRFRGVSLSGQKPALQVSVGYDDPRGWYGGLFGSTVQLADESSTTGQAIGFAGVTTPLAGGFNWDLGADFSAFSRGHDYDYAEVYAGIGSASLSARVHYSPDYFGASRSSWYGELDANHALGNGLVIAGHLGILVPNGSGYAAPGSVRNPLDAQLSVGGDVAGLHVRIGWVGTNGGGAGYPVYGNQRRNTVVVSATLSF